MPTRIGIRNVPLIGVFVLLAWGTYDLTKGRRRQVLALSVTGIAGIALCAVLTRRQIAYWSSGESLFRHTIQVTRNNYWPAIASGLSWRDEASWRRV